MSDAQKSPTAPWIGGGGRDHPETIGRSRTLPQLQFDFTPPEEAPSDNDDQAGEAKSPQLETEIEPPVEAPSDGDDQAGEAKSPQLETDTEPPAENPLDDHDQTEDCKKLDKRGRQLVAQLNERWRIIDDPLQWILQVRKGRKTKKASGWRNRSYCTQRAVLLRCIREYCGEVDPAALAIVEALPKRHLDWDRASIRKRR